MRTYLLRAAATVFVGLTTTIAIAESVPDRDVRESAERILSDPAFQGFDRFPKGTTAPEASPATSPNSSSEGDARDDDSSSSSSQPQNWWDRLLSRKKSTTTKKAEGSGGQPSGESSPTNSQKSSDNATGSPGDEKSSENAAKPAKPESSNAAPSEPARPQRASGVRTPPSQRGHDGVTRPVRFAPKAPQPRSDWNWGLNLSWLDGLGTILGSILHALAYLALAAVCVLILLLVARAVADRARSRTGGVAVATAVTPLAHDRSPGETEADQFLREALRLAESGDFRAALGQLVLGAMSSIERQQWIRYRRGLTLNDYLRSVRSRPEQFTGFQSVVDSYEPVEYGRRLATEPVFATALAGYRQAFAPSAPGG